MHVWALQRVGLGDVADETAPGGECVVQVQFLGMWRPARAWRPANTWHFRMPALHINGAGTATREDAQRQGLEAICTGG